MRLYLEFSTAVPTGTDRVPDQKNGPLETRKVWPRP